MKKEIKGLLICVVIFLVMLFCLVQIGKMIGVP